ncbi:oxidoreductase [Agromyces rhizosphaerae]|uniref:Oxidoreductase n=1 Tax=Agromyces rhizosphaerae TaxID=88374 RepID=A0A9W6CX79_9MICO|nr:FAD-binding oxidoreductase [Agromyces rhizosphaerae]GLI26979.1 oxidoreductase [Agromyces rhizosphaerae]
MSVQLDDLRAGVDGRVVAPGDDGYDDARAVYNGMIDRRPAAVVRCASVDDVRAVVRAAAASGDGLVVRGGAHNVAGFGTADGVLVADLGDLHDVRVDVDARTAVVGGGARWRHVMDATEPHGLATTGGLISTTGVGGLTLGGGIGFLSRRFGLACDNVVSAEVVLADGSVVTASETSEPELYWAIRGGGGSFGVVTSFTFQLHEVPSVVGGPIFFSLDDAPAVLDRFAEFIRTAPREYGGFPALDVAGPAPFMPPDRVGEPMFAVISCWTGDPDEGLARIGTFRDVAEPVAEHVGPVSYAFLNSANDASAPAGNRQYWRPLYLDDIGPSVGEAVRRFGPLVPGPSSVLHLYPFDGAVQDVPADATAFGERDAGYLGIVAGSWADPADDERAMAWVREFHGAIADEARPGRYSNFSMGDGGGSEHAGLDVARLRAAKHRYDPDNVFRFNRNVES